MRMVKEYPRFNFLGLNFHNLSVGESIMRIEDFIKNGKPHMAFTPNAELIVLAHRNPYLRELYNRTDLLTIDSYGVYYFARLLGKSVREPVNAARLMIRFLDVANKKKYRIYLLGAREEIVAKTVENIKKRYPKINIVGWHNGYFKDDREVVNEIKAKRPDVLFVAMSSPLKENFTSKNLELMNVPVTMGVGGSFDIISGKCKLAPEWVSRIGMEWFYRFIQEPRRLFKRYLFTNFQFLWLVMKEVLNKYGIV